ncbi:MAG: hypothetical protein FP816_09040 [Desulfobacteraceae bacterium]|nr:hypothetical protein [Desulfobacteraceae bacterium]
MLRLTDHFIKNWALRVGGVPTVEQVQHIIRESLVVQSCSTYAKRNGDPHRVLAIYWHTGLDVVLKVDEFSGNVVTVMSKSTKGNPYAGSGR